MPNTTTSQVSGFPGVQEFMPDANEHRRQMARKINSLNNAKFNVAVDVTLNASTGATVVYDQRIGFRSAITPLMGMSPEGAAAIAAGIWCDGVMGGPGTTTSSITVHHASNASTNQRIRFGIFG